MMIKDDNEKMMEEIKRIAKQGIPKQEEVEEEIDDDVVLSKEDFTTLIELAKKQDIKEMQQKAGSPIEIAKPVQVSQYQPKEEFVVNTESIPNVSMSSMGFGNLLNRPTVLYFDTDRTCQLIQPKVDNSGKVMINDRTFDFTRGQPSILNMGSFGKKESHPFYVVKYDSMTPVDVAGEYPATNPTPEQASRLINLGTLETLSKIPGGKVKKWILILIMIVSIAIGFITCWMLSMFGVI